MKSVRGEGGQSVAIRGKKARRCACLVVGFVWFVITHTITMVHRRKKKPNKRDDELFIRSKQHPRPGAHVEDG